MIGKICPVFASLLLGAAVPAAASPIDGTFAAGDPDEGKGEGCLDWQPDAQPPQAPHERLRAKAGVPLPATLPMVLIHVRTAHHVVAEWSFAAARGADGLWRVDRVGMRGPDPFTREAALVPPKAWLLTRADGRRVDAILDDPRLYAGPLPARASASGGAETIVDILGERRGATFVLSGPAAAPGGLPEQLLALLTAGAESDCEACGAPR